MTVKGEKRANLVFNLSSHHKFITTKIYYFGECLFPILFFVLCEIRHLRVKSVECDKGCFDP